MKKHYLMWLLAALLVPVGANAQITEFPYMLDFENGLDGWTAIDGDGDGYNWEINMGSTFGTPAHSGTYLVTSASYDNSFGPLSPDNWLVSPAITLGSDPMDLSWYHYTQDANYPAEHYAVYVSTTGNTVADFTGEPLFETTLTAADHDWTYNAVSLADYAGQTIYVAFRHYNCTDMFYFHLDDISIDASPACTQVYNIEVNNITTTGAELSFSMPSAATAAMFIVNGVQQADLTSGSYTFTDLEPGTTYTIQLYSLCDDNDTSYVATTQFITECENITTLPYNWDFEEGHANCWPHESMYWHVNGQGYGYDGSDYAIYSSANSGGQFLISPVIELAANAQNVIFNAQVHPMNSVYYNAPVSFKIWVSENGATEFDSTSFVEVLDSTLSASGYVDIRISLDEYAGQNITVAIENTTVSTQNVYLFVDNISIRSTSAPVVTLPATATADVNMVATFAAVITEGVLENMTYTWTSTMEAAGNATMSAADSLLTITYTAAGEDTVTVIAANDHGSSTATMHVHVRLCNAIDSLPWLETFDSAYATECWIFIDADGNGTTWSVNTNGYLFGQYNSAGPDDWAITPAVVVSDEADGLVLSWDVWGGSWDVDNFYQVLASPTAGMSTGDFTDTLFSESYPENTWVNRTAAISQYAGQTVRFAFRHINTGDDDGMRIDNVSVRTSYEPILMVSGPNGIQVGDTAVFTATLNEGAADGLVFTFANQDATANASTDSNVYTIVYTATGTDTITVIATNSYGADTVVIPVNIFDLNPASLPYTCGYEPADQDTSWFIVNNGANGWYIDTAAHNGGSYGLYISADSGATCGYDIVSSSISHAYRAIHFDQAGQYAVSFDWQANGESSFDFLRAYMAPTDAALPTTYSGITYGSLPAGFIAIDGGDRLNQSTGWQTASGVLTIDAPATMLLVFSWRNDYSVGNQPPAAIDNIGVHMLSCPQPTAIAIDSTGSDYIAFSWVPAGEETEWEVTIDSVSTVVTDTVFTAENLESNTEYTIRVRAICSEGDSSFATSVSVSTECGTITLPYHESFENGGEECWYFATTGTYANYHSINTYTAAEGSKSLRLYMNSVGTKNYAILPEFDNVNTLMITFQSYDYYDEQNQIEVGTMASPTNTASFVPLFSTVGTDIWEEHEVRFDADTTGNRYIAFRTTGAASYTYVLIDDITVMVAPSCQRPESVSVSDIETDGATIDITDSTDVNNYQVIVVNTSTGDTVYNQLVNSVSQQVTGLEAFTSYSVTAYAICDDGNATSAVYTTFRTACEGGSCEFTVAMVDSYGDGWNGNAINVWQNGANVDVLTIEHGSSNTEDVSVCLGSEVVLTWQSGNFASETSFSISKDDSTILSAGGSTFSSGDTLVVFDGQCGVSYVYGGSTPIDTIPEPPQPVPCNAPSINAATATNATVTVVWSGSASSYEVAIVEGAWQAPAAGTPAAGPSHTFTGLTASTQYTVGVRSICDDTVSSWATRSVTTASNDTTTEGIDGVTAATFGLYPNPASSTVTVDLGGESAALVSVIDQSGRKSGEWRVESGKLEINVSDMAKGAYFVRVTTNSGTSVRKLIVK